MTETAHVFSFTTELSTLLSKYDNYLRKNWIDLILEDVTNPWSASTVSFTK
jgi:hypothetical protein